MDAQAPVGVVAKSQTDANSLIHGLGLAGARALSTRAERVEGMRLRAVLIDSSALPLSDQYEAVLRGNLLKTPGSAGMFVLHTYAVR
jgi:hypothetical protein